MYIPPTEILNYKAWNFLTITYHSDTKHISLWKNQRRVHDQTLSTPFKPSRTVQTYFTVGYMSTYFRAAHLVNYKGKLACLQMYDEVLSADQIYRVIYECVGQNDLHQGKLFDIFVYG